MNVDYLEDYIKDSFSVTCSLGTYRLDLPMFGWLFLAHFEEASLT